MLNEPYFFFSFCVPLRLSGVTGNLAPATAGCASRAVVMLLGAWNGGAVFAWG